MEPTKNCSEIRRHADQSSLPTLEPPAALRPTEASADEKRQPNRNGACFWNCRAPEVTVEVDVNCGLT
jgi:hypothetical protein